LIVAIDGQPLANPPQFIASLYGKRVGSQARLEVLRGSQPLVLTVSVAERTSEPQELPDPPTLERGLIAKLGVVCMPVNQHATSYATLRSKSGLIVITKLEGAEISSDLMSGDVIRSLNGMPIMSVEDLRSELDKLGLGTGVVLQVERELQFRYISFEVD
jgi:S1-C subfamily serine protease